MKKIFTSLLALGFLWINGYSQVYIDETFDSDIPSDWTTTSTGPGTAAPWFWNDGTGTQTLNGTGYARVDSDADGNGNHMIEDLESPAFDASAGNIIVLQFEQRFQWGGQDSATVQVWDGSVWHNVAVYNSNTLGNWNDPDYVTLIITGYVNSSGDSKVRFHYDDGNSWAWTWSIDNVSISSVDCLEPLNINIEPAAISADVSWDSGSGSSDIVFGPVGVDPDDLAGTGGTQVDDAANPYTITGLDPETTYEVYLRDDCGADGMSPWAGPFSYTTTVACPDPTLSTWGAFEFVSSFYAEMIYSQNGAGDVYMIIGPADFVPGGGLGDTTLLTGSPYTITGLDAETDYDVYLYMDCTANPDDSLGYSSIVGPSGFTTLPACPTPTGNWPYTDNITSTSADILYTLNGPGDGYVVIGPEDFLPGDPLSDTIALTGSPFTLTGLEPLSFYSYFIFMDCNADGYGYSENTTTRSFNTLTDASGTSCGDPYVLSSANMPYTAVNQSVCGYGNNVTASTCNYGGYEEIVYVYSPETADEILGIYGANSELNATIYFSITNMCPDSSGAECVASGTWSSSDPTYLLTTEAGDLTEGEVYYITVSGPTYNGCFLDLQIFVIDCNTPSNLTYENYADSTVLTWDFVNDSTTNWQVVWGVEGFDLGSEGTTVSGTYENGQSSATLTITGLSDTTGYEFYVFDECGFNNVSIPAGPGYFVGPPPVNDLCENATPISCNETLVGTNITANDEGNSLSLCEQFASTPEGPTVWYTFEGTGDEITLSTCGTDWNTGIWVYTGSCADSLECADYSIDNYYLGEYQCGSGNYDPSFVSIQSEAGVTYTVAVAAGSTWSPQSGEFNLTMNCVPCSYPYELEVLSVSNDAALINWETFNPGATYNYEYGYDGFTPGSGLGTGTGIVGTDGPTIMVEGLLADTTYQFYLFEECTVGSTDSLWTSFTTNLEAPPANDLCENAQVIACGESDTSSIANATTFGNPLGPICGSTYEELNVNTIWYQFEGTGQEMNLTSCGSNRGGTNSFYAKMAIFTGDCDNLECVVLTSYDTDLDCPTPPYGSTNVSIYGEVGVTYYVAFTATGSYDASNSQTILTLECIDCSVPTDLSASVTDVTAALSWESFNQGADFTLAWDSAGFDYPTEPGNVVTGNNLTDLPVELSGLQAGGTYTFYLFEYCESIAGNTDTVSYTFSTYPEPPPANNDVCNAQALTANDTLATTCLYANVQAGEPAPPTGAWNDPDQLTWGPNNNLISTTWYSFTPEMTGFTTISTCMTGEYFDSQLAVYTMDDCNGFENWTVIAANDDNNDCPGGTGVSSTVSLCLQGGVTYYIQVDPYSDFSTGSDFSIWVEFEGGEVLNAPAFPSPHTATINFTYNSTIGGNVDYTLYYTNTTTNEESMVTGNTADLPIVIDGLDDATMYEYHVVCNDACNTTSEVSNFQTLPDGITELGFGRNVSVYPNPATDKITIEINAEVNEGSVISIISLQGKVIYSELVKENTSDYRTEIDVDNYARGVYLLKLEDENSSIQQRIIVQ